MDITLKNDIKFRPQIRIVSIAWLEFIFNVILTFQSVRLEKSLSALYCKMLNYENVLKYHVFYEGVLSSAFFLKCWEVNSSYC
jgi:hypothetical protein